MASGQRSPCEENGTRYLSIERSIERDSWFAGPIESRRIDGRDAGSTRVRFRGEASTPFNLVTRWRRHGLAWQVPRRSREGACAPWLSHGTSVSHERARGRVSRRPKNRTSLAAARAARPAAFQRHLTLAVSRHAPLRSLRPEKLSAHRAHGSF